MRIRDLMPFIGVSNDVPHEDIFDLIHREMNRAMDDTYHGQSGRHEYLANGPADETPSGRKGRVVEVFQPRTDYSAQAKSHMQPRNSSGKFDGRANIRPSKISTR